MLSYKDTSELNFGSHFFIISSRLMEIKQLIIVFDENLFLILQVVFIKLQFSSLNRDAYRDSNVSRSEVMKKTHKKFRDVTIFPGIFYNLQEFWYSKHKRFALNKSCFMIFFKKEGVFEEERKWNFLLIHAAEVAWLLSGLFLNFKSLVRTWIYFFCMF